MRPIILTFSFLVSFSIFAQISIVSIEVSPLNPSHTDEVIIQTIAGATSDGYEYNYSYNIENDTIRLTGCYVVGLGASAPAFIKTTDFGILPPTTYTVIYKLTRAEYPDYICNLIDADTIQFTVDLTNEIENLSFNEQIKLNPNPTTNTHVLTIQSNGKPLNIELYDVQGRLIKTVFNGESSLSEISIPIDVSDLNKGMYLYKIQKGEQNAIVRFVKQ